MADGRFRNEYWVLRHGRSIPNELGLIVSHLSNGTLPQFGLAAEGFAQAEAAGNEFSKELSKSSKVAIYSSPFTRTMETAKCVAEALAPAFGNIQIQVLDELRERYFGPAFELQSHLRYPEIWEIDGVNPYVGPEGGESVAAVAERVCKAVSYVESQHNGFTVLLVSHGDTAQILQAIASDPNYDASILSQHRKYALNTGELRRLS